MNPSFQLTYNWGFPPGVERIKVHLDSPARLKVLSPDRTESLVLEASGAQIDVDVYTLLILE